MRDLITHLMGMIGLANQASLSTQQKGPAIDCRGFNALAMFVFVGAGTLNDANNYLLSMEEADADVNGNPVNWGAVPEAKLFGDRVLKAPNTVYKLGTSATLHRFVRLVITPVGTTASQVSATAIAGHLGSEGKAW